MYSQPHTLFAAEFMGSNNRLHGKITHVEGGRARIAGAKWALWGKATGDIRVGQEGTAVIRVERLHFAETTEDNFIELPLLHQHVLG